MNFTYDEICKIIGNLLLQNENEKKALHKHIQETQEQLVQLKQQQFKDGQSTSTEDSK